MEETGEIIEVQEEVKKRGRPKRIIEEPTTTLYEGISEAIQEVDDIIEVEKTTKVGGLKVLGCGTCGEGKNHNTHSYGKYRVYECYSGLILKCQTCNKITKYRIIR